MGPGEWPHLNPCEVQQQLQLANGLIQPKPPSLVIHQPLQGQAKTRISPRDIRAQAAAQLVEQHATNGKGSMNRHDVIIPHIMTGQAIRVRKNRMCAGRRLGFRARFQSGEGLGFRARFQSDG